MRVYLDTCSLQRPLDAKTQARIHLEAEAVLDVLSLCETGQIELVASEILQFEIERVSHPLRRTHAYEVLSKATAYIDTTESVMKRAKDLIDNGIKPLDAFHLASAIEATADYFCTCDDKLLRRAKVLNTEKTKTVSPIELIVELGL